jgi:putative peptidoglycan lipid II flippase
VSSPLASQEPTSAPDEASSTALNTAPVKGHSTALQAALLLSALYFLSKLTGLFQQQIIMAALPRYATDAYVAAFRLTDFVNHLVAGGALSITFIPLFTELRERKSDEEAWQFFSSLLLLMGLIVTALVIICVLKAELLMSWIAPGLKKSGDFQLAVLMSQIILPGQIFFVLGGITVASLNAQKRFGATGFTGALYNVVAVIIAVIWWQVTGEPTAFAWGILVGAFAGYVLLPFGAVLSGPPELRPQWHFRFPPRHPLFKTYFLTALPIMFGVSFPIVDQIVIGYFASEGSGWMTYLSNGNRLMIVAQSVLAQAAAVAAFPYLASDSAAQDWQKVADFLRQGLRRLMFITLVLSTWMVLTASPIVDLIYAYGKYKDPQALHETAIAYAFYSMGLFAWAGQQLVARGFYALKDTRTPTIIGSIITIGFFIPLVWFCAQQSHPVLLLALATSIGACVHFSAMLVAFENKLQNDYGAELGAHRVCGTLLRTVMACVLMGIAGLIGLHFCQYLPLQGKTGSLVSFLIISLAAWPTLVLACRRFGIPEFEWLWNRVAGKVTARLRR